MKQYPTPKEYPHSDIIEDPVPMYDDSFEHDDPDDKIRKKIHNNVAMNAIKMVKEANENADKINQEWVPNFRKLALIGKIRDVFFLLFGMGVLLLGMFMGYSDNGFAPLTVEQLGVMLAGIGLATTSLYSLVSFNDDMFHLVIISRTNENHMFANMQIIQAQLSFLRNEIIDIRKCQLKEQKEKTSK